MFPLSGGRVSRRIVLSALLLLFAVPRLYAAVTVEFVLDGSGSMWGKLYDQYKIVVLKRGMENYLEEAPPQIRFALRAFGLPGGEGCSNTRLLVPPSLDSRQEILRAVKRMNPTGQAPVIFSLRKGLKDLGRSVGKKVLILIADGSDSCEEDIPGAIEKVSQALTAEEEVHVVALGVTNAKDRSELSLLAAKSNGTFYSVSNSSQLVRRVRRIVSMALKEEKERLRLQAEEEARQAALARKTRLVVEFVSDVSGFFCSGIRILDLKVDGVSMTGAGSIGLGCSDRVRVLDQPFPKGKHSVSLTYRKDNHGDMTSSRPGTFMVRVQPGKTTRLTLTTAGHLFYWGLDAGTDVKPTP